MGEIKIVWDIQAKLSFEEQIKHIKSDSPQAAEKVRSAIFDKIRILADYPKKHPVDKFKLNNDGNFRAFEKYRIRIAYFITESQIRIIRVCHASQEPEQY